MRQFMAIAKALADENRVRAMLLLRSGELCLCQIIEMLALAPSTVSKHMAVLRGAGLVESRKSGRWHYYRLAGDDGPKCAAETVRWLTRCLGRDKQVLADSRRLKSVRKMRRAELCLHYKS